MHFHLEVEEKSYDDEEEEMEKGGGRRMRRKMVGKMRKTLKKLRIDRQHFEKVNDSMSR